MFRLGKESKICRKYRVDLWNNLSVSKGSTRVLDLLVEETMNRRNKVREAAILGFEQSRSSTNRGRLSNFGEILSLRNKLRYFYGGLSKKRYRLMNKLATTLGGDPVGNMLMLLECRLSSVVFRMHFASTMVESISLIFGGHILVNRKVVTYPHYLVHVGDVIEVSDFLKPVKYAQALDRKLSGVGLPFVRYQEVNLNCMSGIVVAHPELEEIPFTFNVSKNFFLGEFLEKN